MNPQLPPDSDSHVERSSWNRRLRVAAFTFLFGIAPISASPTSAEPDELLAFKAKAALAADPVLARVNVWVFVVDRVALVGGPVPDSGTALRIESILRGVPGLAEVKVRCWVPTMDDGFGQRVKDAMTAPQREIPPLVYPAPPGGLKVDPKLMAWQPGAPQGTDAVVVQRPSKPALDGFLLEPVMTGPGGPKPLIPELPMPNDTVGVPNLPPQGVPLVPPSVKTTATLEEMVGAIRASDPRYGWLTIRLNQGTATISGHAVRIADAWDYAAALQKIPGIDRVIVGDIRPR